LGRRIGNNICFVSVWQLLSPLKIESNAPNKPEKGENRAGKGRNVEILAITSMRNEGPHCLEWFAHHLAAGVDHFLVYSNDCDDGTDLILDRLAAAGIVTHVRQGPPGNKTVQWQAFKHATGHELLRRADWAIVFDCDEFINLRAPLDSLQDLVAALPAGTDAVAMPWRLFGNAGHCAMADDLTITRFTKAAPEQIALPLAHFFKTLFRVDAFRQLGVHRPKYKKKRVPNWVEGSGRALPEKFGEMDGRINLYGVAHRSDLVQLNHYSLRSAAGFMVKRARGLPNHMRREIGLGYWAERNFNTVDDNSIGRMVAGTQARLDDLRADPELEALHLRACAAHGAKFEQMMTDRGNIQLYWHLVLSAGSTPPTPEMARVQIDRIMRAQG
jgi:hypothetical protein